MKKFTIEIANRALGLSYFVFIALLLIGCNKEESIVEISGGERRLLLYVKGVADVQQKLTANAAPSTKKMHQRVALIENQGFDALLFCDNRVPDPVSSAFSRVEPIGDFRMKALRGSTLLQNTRYRVFLYKKFGNTYVYYDSYPFSVGQEVPVIVPYGTYKWVALSYNNTENLPERGATDNLALPANKDVLVASSSSDIVIDNTDVSVEIMFKRLYARIAVEINTQGAFAELSSATVSVTGHTAKGGTINLSTAEVGAPYSESVSPALTFPKFVPIDSDRSRMVAYYYTADPSPQNVQVNVTDVKVTLDNAALRNYGGATLVNNVRVLPLLGQNHRILVGITETPLTYAGVEWSRSNLYYKEARSTPYRFNPSNLYSSHIDQNSYFSFKGHIPRKFASAVPALQKDPCALVYPAQLWKTPTKNDLASIQNQEGLLGNLLGNLGQILGLGATPGAYGGSDYIEFTPSSGVNLAYGSVSAPENKLRFNYNGLQRDIEIIEGLITLNLGSSKGSQGAFWTDTQGLNLLGLAGVGAWSYLGYTGRNIMGRAVPKGNASAGLLNINLVGLNLISSDLMNVRCVRNPEWQTISAAEDYDPNPVL